MLWDSMPWNRQHAMEPTACHGTDSMPWNRQHAMEQTACHGTDSMPWYILVMELFLFFPDSDSCSFRDSNTIPILFKVYYNVAILLISFSHRPTAVLKIRIGSKLVIKMQGYCFPNDCLLTLLLNLRDVPLCYCSGSTQQERGKKEAEAPSTLQRLSIQCITLYI